MNGFLQDLRYGVRQFVKAPGLSLVIVITIALGVGANTALFSVVNGVLLNPFPYPHPEQLVTLHESKPNFDHGSISFRISTKANTSRSCSPPEFQTCWSTVQPASPWAWQQISRRTT